ncbi:hypothetical protein [Streptomyces sp. NPDC014685]|uniref:hypothetical protein n=1 Tax=Streptomyces sp. NPDC014685 TaxID=3364881 RepID=UPI0036F8361B
MANAFAMPEQARRSSTAGHHAALIDSRATAQGRTSETSWPPPPDDLRPLLPDRLDLEQPILTAYTEITPHE